MAKPGIQISKPLIAKLPKMERGTQEHIAQLLWKKSGGVCFLCGAEMNRAADTIVPDHDVPESEGDSSKVNRLSNLNLAHTGCNAFKREHPTAPVSAFLRFRRFLLGRTDGPLYSDCLEYFKITPAATHVTRDGDLITFEFPDGSKRTAHIFEETNRNGTFLSCFVDVPSEAVFHDEDCQPRTIKDKQVWLIYSDLQRNPLHEPPACRTEATTGPVELLMFDGQHKTVASLLMKRGRIPIKIYLDLPAEQTRHLVNSIQAKIPKLGLSAFELMTKMGAEYKDRLTLYTESEEAGSEEGFLESIPPDQRRRAKQAFENACIANVWGDPELELVQAVKKFGGKGRKALTETKIKDKLLKPLLSMKPMSQPFEVSEPIRERERVLARTIVNEWVKRALAARGTDPDPKETTGIERRLYQPSIEYFARLMRKAAAHTLKIDEDDSLGLKKATDDDMKAIRKIVARLVSHGVWTHAYTTKRMKAVQDALAKNQNADAAFRDVGLNLGYALTGDLEKNWAG